MELCYSGYMTAVKRVNVPQLFKDLGYLNLADVNQRVTRPHQAVPPNKEHLPTNRLDVVVDTEMGESQLMASALYRRITQAL